MRYGAFLLLFQRVYCSKRQEDPLRLLSCLRFFLQYPKAVKNYDALFFHSLFECSPATCFLVSGIELLFGF